MGGVNQKFALGSVNFEIPIGHVSGVVEDTDGCTRSGLEISIWGLSFYSLCLMAWNGMSSPGDSVSLETSRCLRTNPWVLYVQDIGEEAVETEKEH